MNTDPKIQIGDPKPTVAVFHQCTNLCGVEYVAYTLWEQLKARGCLVVYQFKRIRHLALELHTWNLRDRGLNQDEITGFFKARAMQLSNSTSLFWSAPVKLFGRLFIYD